LGFIGVGPLRARVGGRLRAGSTTRRATRARIVREVRERRSVRTTTRASVAVRTATVLASRASTHSDCRHVDPQPRKQGIQMTKGELIDAVANRAGVSKVDADKTIQAFFELVVSSTKKGDKVSWPGFGAFSTSQRKARIGRNPQTGAPVQVPASIAMKFSSSSTLKAELNPNRK
jgi:DNA-binding protein HU-beta